MWLTACAASTEPAPPPLPPEPAGLQDCAAAAVPPIPGAPGTPLNKTDAAIALAEQRAAAFGKDRCARAWRDFYDDLRQALAAP
jgi:hypothetical protein